MASFNDQIAPLLKPMQFPNDGQRRTPANPLTAQQPRIARGKPPTFPAAGPPLASASLHTANGKFGPLSVKRG